MDLEINRPNLDDIKPSVVSYLDILGYKDIIRDMEGAVQLFNAILDVVERTKEMVSRLTSNTQIPGSLSCKFFSDNAIISCGYNPEPKSQKECYDNTISISLVLMIQAVVQTDLLSKHGLLSRGGITLGDYYRDENIVFGSGLVDAYILENNAETPRMLVDEKVIDAYVRFAKGAKLPVDSVVLGRVFMKDYDKKTYIHYLNAGSVLMAILSEGSNSNDCEILEEHRAGILRAIRANMKLIQSNRKIMRKYVWAIAYHNDVVELSGFGEKIDYSELSACSSTSVE